MVEAGVAIIGGSVAGSSLAIALGAAGVRTVVFEKATFPRAKACGEGLLPHGLEALAALGLPNPPGAAVAGLRYRAPSGASVEVRFDEAGLGPGRVVRRDVFDSWLLGHARATPNVEVREGEQVSAVDTRPEGVHVNDVRARIVVGADGIRSIFHAGAGFTRTHPRRARVGYSTRVRGVAVGGFVEIHLAAGGEGYVGPAVGGESVLAVLVDRGLRFEEFVARVPALRGLERTSPILGASPLGSHVRPTVAGRVLLVGDAAGAPDPVTGEGMSLTLQSALVGAAIIREALETGALGGLQRYQRERARLAAPSLRIGRWIVRASRAPWLAERAVARLASDPPLLRRLVRHACGVQALGLLDPARVLL